MQVPCTNKGGHAPCKIEQCFTYTCSHRFGTKDIKWRVSKTTFECAADTKLNPISWVTLPSLPACGCVSDCPPRESRCGCEEDVQRSPAAVGCFHHLQSSTTACFVAGLSKKSGQNAGCHESMAYQTVVAHQLWCDLWGSKYWGWILSITSRCHRNMVHQQGAKVSKGRRKLSQSLSSPTGTPRTPGEERQLPLLAGSSSNKGALGSRKASSCTLSPSIPALPLSSSSPPQAQVPSDLKIQRRPSTTSLQNYGV